jgi:alcohol dehydrogenase class IV
MQQEEHEGPGTAERLPDLVRRTGARRVLLVTGRASFDACGAAGVVERALRGLRVERVDDFGSTLHLADVERAAERARRLEPDLILAVGGGSVLDMAKAAAACVASPEPVRALMTGRAAPGQGIPPILALPTTAGSGSEATHFAVVYVDGSKHALAEPRLRPACVVLDADLTRSLPPDQTAYSGMDALAQAVESAWSVHSTGASRRLSFEAIGLVGAALPAAVNRPDPESRRTMLRAANLAGKAIDIARTTACHALSYAMTLRYGVPHGLAVSLTLGEMLVYNAAVSAENVSDPRGAPHVRRTLAEVARRLGAGAAEEARTRIMDLMRSIHLPVDLAGAGIGGADAIEHLVRSVNAERLANNPRRLDEPALRSILRAVSGR